MRGPLLFLAVVVVVVLAHIGIPHCWGWVPDFVQGLCLCGVVVETVMVRYGSLPLNYCESREQLQPIGMNMGVVMVVYTLVLPAILLNVSATQEDCRV